MLNPKRLGIMIVIASIVVLGLLLSLKIQMDGQLLNACTEACGNQGQEVSAACTMEACPYHQSSGMVWIPIIASLFVAAVAGIGVYLAFAKTEKVIEEKEYDLSKLNHEEKHAFLLIKEEKEGVYQSDLIQKLNLSKVQVTRLLDKLEQHGLIERKRRGMTNILLVK